ncbi:DUF4167 domain-containing protein [Caenibius tardaugens NBRC 16725]|nr:DUF4167 domain-containing protein [Caenibius tardaugens NBRC 16725]
MTFPLNNNRNNRRRGRGNNRSQGGGNQLNRIDSRARGNAPQLLEKYRKLAHDASLNGDRVQTEYYLQFADHYFRVLADAKARQDEQRVRRDDTREQMVDSDDDDEFGGFHSDRGRARRPERDELPAQDNDAESGSDADSEQDRQAAPNEYEPPSNPFTRSNRERPAAQRRQRKPRADQAEEAGDRAVATDDAEPSLDLSVLPPAIGDRGEDEEVKAPAPRRRRTVRAKPAAEGDDETLQKAS